MEKLISEKLDANLQAIYQKYIEANKNVEPGIAAGNMEEKKNIYNLSLRYENNLVEIESLGYKTSWKQLPGLANGYVDLKDLEKIVAHPNVISLSAGSTRKVKLDHSVKDMNVRSDTTGGVGTLGRWHMDTATGVITAPAPSGFTGKGVVVGIIDTGIDVHHPCFRTGTPGSFTSRILKYWDQGLDPKNAVGFKGPDVSLLEISTSTYGVEFNRAAIQGFLNNGTACPSKDCTGHGTHVAAIAAGNGNDGGPYIFKPKPEFKYAGVAPEADIVMVKFLDVPDGVKDKNDQPVSQVQAYRDAIYYIMKVAMAEIPNAKPAVINCSFGSEFGPHDGLTEDEQLINTIFSPGSPYYSGNIMVNVSGNEAGSRQNAIITIPPSPPSGEITIPFTLYDVRAVSDIMDLRNCREVDGTDALRIEIWYQKPASDNAVAVQVRVPGDTIFSDKVFHGHLWKFFDNNKKRTLTHTQIPPVDRPDAGGGPPVSVKRNQILLEVEPNRNTNPFQHKTGLYELKISAPAGTVLYAWTAQSGKLGFIVGTFTQLTHKADAGSKKIIVRQFPGFKVGDTIEIILDSALSHTTTITKLKTGSDIDSDEIEFADPLPSKASAGNDVSGKLPAGVLIEDKFQINTDGGAKNALTVASYDDNKGVVIGNYRNISDFSSRGPLVDYSGLGPFANKPEITAPGNDIMSAESGHVPGFKAKLSRLFGRPFTEHNGTSMAAPHVTGLVALFLQKNKTLNIDQVKAIFSTTTNNEDGRHPVPAQGDTYTEAFGGGITDGIKSVGKVP